MALRLGAALPHATVGEQRYAAVFVLLGELESELSGGGGPVEFEELSAFQELRCSSEYVDYLFEIGLAQGYDFLESYPWCSEFFCSEDSGICRPIVTPDWQCAVSTAVLLAATSAATRRRPRGPRKPRGHRVCSMLLKVAALESPDGFRSVWQFRELLAGHSELLKPWLELALAWFREAQKGHIPTMDAQSWDWWTETFVELIGGSTGEQAQEIYQNLSQLIAEELFSTAEQAMLRQALTKVGLHISTSAFR